MKFFKKRSTAWAVLAVVILISFFVGPARKKSDEVQILPAGEYIQDNAGVLSDSTEKYITRMNNDLVSKTGGEIHVITLDTTGDKGALDTALNRGVDLNMSANSCVFLIAVDDVDRAIVQGEELMYAFSDSELTDLLRSTFTVSDFEKKTLDAPAREAFDELIDMYNDYYFVNITGADNITVVQQSAGTAERRAVSVLVMALIILLIVLVIVSRSRRRRFFGPVIFTSPRPRPPRTGNYPPRGSYHMPPPPSRPTGGWFSSGGFGSSSRGGSFGSSSRSGGFGSSSRGGSFGSSSRSGGFGSSSRGGSFRGGRGGSFRGK